MFPIIDSKNIAYKYSKIQNCRQELENVKNYWRNLLGRLQVYTPLESMNIILNGWDIYQTIQSRLLAKTGYYQSGGAYGFRDQLQDTLGLKYINPEKNCSLICLIYLLCLREYFNFVLLSIYLHELVFVG